jgi:hypothetical protein
LRKAARKKKDYLENQEALTKEIKRGEVFPFGKVQGE